MRKLSWLWFGRLGVPQAPAPYWHRAVNYLWDMWPIRVFPGDEIWTDWT